jgi:hypothetical protein
MSEAVADIKAPTASLPVEAVPVVATTERVPALEPAEARALPEAEVSEEPVAATTFADAVRDQEVENVSATAEFASSGAAVAETHLHEEISSSENAPGGDEDMATEEKGKSGKSTWRQLRSGTPTAATDAVEAAKQSEESPKTMAAAASAEGGSDVSTIAGIVDSVLADLRPKIVEEIAKQLAKK